MRAECSRALVIHHLTYSSTAFSEPMPMRVQAHLIAVMPSTTAQTPLGVKGLSSATAMFASTRRSCWGAPELRFTASVFTTPSAEKVRLARISPMPSGV